MGTAQEFLESLPWSLDLHLLWQGQSGVAIIDNDRRATITLATHGRADHYEGCNVEITSKTIGRIMSKWFAFDEYLHERTDIRSDHPIGSSNPCFYVWHSRGDWSWYIAIPAHPEHFTQAVEGWIDQWQ